MGSNIYRKQMILLQNIHYSGIGLLPGFKKPVKTVFKYIMKKPIIEMYKQVFFYQVLYIKYIIHMLHIIYNILYALQYI